MTEAYPLKWPEGWPRTAPGARRRAKFHTTGRTWGTGKKELSIADGAERIAAELHTMGVRDGKWLISSNLELRNDGMPRSSQRMPDDPGIAVYWYRKGKQQVMAIDRYDRVADNLAAVAATLGALRAIERHGGGQILDRAFEGFTALANPDIFDPYAVLGVKPDATAEEIRVAFRRRAADAHPDAPGGSTEAFQRLERAKREALEKAG